MSDPQTNLNAQALLASLSFTLCRQSKQSKQESAKVEDTNHATRGVARVSIHYFQETQGKETSDALGPLKQHFNAWRSEHNRLTRPWDQGSTRLLPAALVPQYLNVKSTFEQATPALIAEFVSVYPDWETTAPERMGSLYSPDDYPTLEQCRQDIGFQCSMIPLPSGEQWKRITLISPDLAATMEAQTNTAIAAAVEAARQQTYADVLSPIQKIVDVLSKDKPRIFDTLISNLSNICDLVPAFNLNGDATLARLASEAKATLASISPDDLRSDPEIRKQTLQSAQTLLASCGEMGRRSFA